MNNKQQSESINLNTLQRYDSFAINIVAAATQVAVYHFTPYNGKWEKADIEGSMFVYQRSTIPHFSFLILNRLSTENLSQPVSSHFQLQIQPPYIMYRSPDGVINGIWFYENTECSKIANVLGNLVSHGSLKRSYSESQAMPPDVPNKLVFKANEDIPENSGFLGHNVLKPKAVRTKRNSPKNEVPPRFLAKQKPNTTVQQLPHCNVEESDPPLFIQHKGSSTEFVHYGIKKTSSPSVMSHKEAGEMPELLQKILGAKPSAQKQLMLSDMGISKTNEKNNRCSWPITDGESKSHIKEGSGQSAQELERKLRSHLKISPTAACPEPPSANISELLTNDANSDIVPSAIPPPPNCFNRSNSSINGVLQKQDPVPPPPSSIEMLLDAPGGNASSSKSPASEESSISFENSNLVCGSGAFSDDNNFIKPISASSPTLVKSEASDSLSNHGAWQHVPMPPLITPKDLMFNTTPLIVENGRKESLNQRSLKKGVNNCVVSPGGVVGSDSNRRKQSQNKEVHSEVLSKTQLLEAMEHMMKNDEGFTERLYECYLKHVKK